MKTTKKDFDIFRKACLKWIDAFGLSEWEWHFHHKANAEEALASYSSDPDGRVAIIYLEPYWRETKVTVKELKKTALHEILHILLLDLQHICHVRVVTEEQITTALHAVIRRLENHLLGIDVHDM